METLGEHPRNQEAAKGSPDCPFAVLGGESASVSTSEQLLPKQASLPEHVARNRMELRARKLEQARLLPRESFLG